MQKINKFHPIVLLLIIFISIFLLEVLIKFVLGLIVLENYAEDIVETIFFSIVLYPLIYVFAIRPLKYQIIKTDESQKELKENVADLQKFKLAVENTAEQIVISDVEGKVLYANPGMEKITGYSNKETVGQKAGKLWGGLMEKSYYEKMWKVIKIDKQTFKGEINNKRKNGENYIAEVIVSPILDENGEVRYFVSVERDITKIKEVDRMKTEFISLASHQLRTPLSGMKWFLEMLIKGDAGELNDKQKEFAKNIFDSNERMIGLVNSLLDVSHIESGKIKIELKPTNFGVLLQEVIEEQNKSASDKNININTEITENLPEVAVDSKLFREVYENLISNAIKYTPQDGKINVNLSSIDHNLITKISDTGLGIPAQQKNRIFEKFFRADNAAKTTPDGNGLGLYFIKEIVEKMNGKIWFESEENQGTTFFVSIPQSNSQNIS